MSEAQQQAQPVCPYLQGDFAAGHQCSCMAASVEIGAAFAQEICAKKFPNCATFAVAAGKRQSE